MSKEFMNICGHERDRLSSKISATENVLSLYRQLWKLYSELEATGEHKATWRAAKNFIAETVSPSLKKELSGYKDSLENVTHAQTAGCAEIAAEERL